MAFFSAAVHVARSAASIRSAARVLEKGLATMRDIAVDAVKATVRTTAQTVKAAACDAVEDVTSAGKRAIKAVGETAKAAARKAKAAKEKAFFKGKALIKKGIDASKKAARFLKRALRKLARKGVRAAVVTCRAARKLGSAVVRGGVSCVNTGINSVVVAAASALTVSETVESAATAIFETDKVKISDGKFLDENCNLSESVPPRGKRPKCGGYVGMRKVFYTNGIQTESSTSCETMKKLAESRCVEVVGVYNATSGLLPDVVECAQNINRAGNAPAVKTQIAFLRDQLADPEGGPVTLFAHSQGGLITQESLVAVKNHLVLKYRKGNPPEDKVTAGLHAESDMNKITVYSFGTAEEGWPKGPTYVRYTNTQDPVPSVIKAVQANHQDIYPNDPVEGTPHRFSKSHINPIASHSMDDVYLQELNRNEPHDERECLCAI